MQLIGRVQELDQLHQWFQQHKLVAITDQTGRGGVGKTDLAIHYSLKHVEDYPGGICWLFPKESDLGTQIVEFARAQFPRFKLPKGLELPRQVVHCWRNWPEGSALIVVDDVVNYEQIQPHLPLIYPKFKVLMTTRQHMMHPIPQLSLGGLCPEAALQLLGSLVGDGVVQRELEAAKGLCRMMDYVPLGLCVAAGYLGVRFRQGENAYVS